MELGHRGFLCDILPFIFYSSRIVGHKSRSFNLDRHVRDLELHSLEMPNSLHFARPWVPANGFHLGAKLFHSKRCCGTPNSASSSPLYYAHSCQGSCNKCWAPAHDARIRHISSNELPLGFDFTMGSRSFSPSNPMNSFAFPLSTLFASGPAAGLYENDLQGLPFHLSTTMGLTSIHLIPAPESLFSNIHSQSGCQQYWQLTTRSSQCHNSTLSHSQMRNGPY